MRDFLSILSRRKRSSRVWPRFARKGATPFSVASFCEMLEPRLLMAASTPTPAEQYLIELINRARANPAAEAAMHPELGPEGVNEGPPSTFISNDPKQPLAPNPFLLDAAQDYALVVLNNGALDHNIGGTSAQGRAATAGYTGGLAGFENLAFVTQTPINARTIEANHNNLFVDFIPGVFEVIGRGHRVNLMNPTLTEIGVGAISGNFGGHGGSVIVEDFAVGPTYITGVAFSDIVKEDNFYTIGEGLASITITATRQSDSQVFQTTTWDSGGYSLQVPNGTYDVVASGAAIGDDRHFDDVVIASQNVKVDVVVGPPPPDLIVEVITEKLPTDVVAGEPTAKGSVTLKVTNISPGSSSGNANINIVASINNTLGDGDDVLLTTLTNQSMNLAGGGGSKNINANVTFPLGMPLGAYHIIAEVDSLNAIEETDETNNVGQGAAVVNVEPAFVDLSADMVSTKFFDTVVAGEKSSAPVMITNAGNITLKETVRVAVQLVPVGGGEGIEIGSAVAKLSLKPGQVKKLNVKVQIGSEIPPGDYTLQAVVDADGQLAEDDETNNAIDDPRQYAVARGFGLLPGRTKAAVITLMQDDVAVKFAMSGPGSGTINIDPDTGEWDVVTEGTTEKSSIKFSTKGGDKTATLRDVMIVGALNAFGGKPIDLTGDFTVTESALKLEFNQVAGSIVNVQGASTNPKAALSVKLNTATDTSLLSAMPLKSLAVNNWADGGGDHDIIDAPFAGSIASKGDLEADIHLSDPTPKQTLGKLSVSQTLRNVLVDSAGPIGSVTLGAMIDSAVRAGIAALPGRLDLPSVANGSDFVNQTEIKSVSVKGFKNLVGPAFRNSVIAGWSLGSINLSLVDLDNAGVPEGVAADTIKSLQVKDLVGTSVKLSKLDDPAALAQLLIDKAIELGDFHVDLV